MKQVIKKAAKYESKKSLEGPMKFLKGNVGKTTKALVVKKKK
jgi:dTDP-D-glucose 4,6-dehydratase